MKCVRYWKCALCGGDLIFDTVTMTLKCKDGETKPLTVEEWNNIKKFFSEMK